jgi:hypothetical protein
MKNKSGKNVGWTHILPQEIKLSQGTTDSDSDLLSPVREHPVSLKDLKNRCEQVKRKILVGEVEIESIEKSTRGQSNESLWFFHRKKRITASKCHRVASLRDSTSPTKTIREVLHYNTAYQSQSMKEGLMKEEDILKDYTALKHEQGHANLTVDHCGFFISKTSGFLGASPDGLVTDPSVEDSKGLAEVKYVQVKEDESLIDALVRKGVCVKKENQLTVNTKHKYHYQIQQQMYVTDRNWTDFVVKGSLGTELFCERVYFKANEWNNVLSKLTEFYDRWIVPELAYPGIKYGLNKLDGRTI